jgi:cell division protein FtsB
LDAIETPPTTSPPGKIRGPRFRLTNWQIILAALIVVGGRLVYDFSQRIIEGQQKSSEQQQLQEEIEQLREEWRQLEAAKAYYSSPAYVEIWAHDDGKMVRDGEILIIPLYDETAPEALAPASDVQVQEPLPSWRVWWALFFDNPPPGS